MKVPVLTIPPLLPASGKHFGNYKILSALITIVMETTSVSLLSSQIAGVAGFDQQAVVGSAPPFFQPDIPCVMHGTVFIIYIG